MSLPLAVLVPALRARLAEPLPGHAAHAEMAPFPVRATLDTISVERNEGRLAATLILLYPADDGEAGLVLTLRQPSLKAHSGQVSLPGGSLEPGETPEDAAHREAWEEVGVDPDAPDILGRLTPLYIPPSRFSVWPVVAAVSERPAFVPQEDEVADLIEVRVSALLDPAVRKSSERDVPLGRFDVPYFDLGGYEVWGATAMMLAEFAAVLADAVAAITD